MAIIKSQTIKKARRWHFKHSSAQEKGTIQILYLFWLILTVAKAFEVVVSQLV